MKSTCQTKIHGGQEKIEGMHIRVSTGANAYTHAQVSMLVDGCWWGEDTSVDAQGLQQLMTDYFNSKHQ